MPQISPINWMLLIFLLIMFMTTFMTSSIKENLVTTDKTKTKKNNKTIKW